jgi:hypothetical protein
MGKPGSPTYGPGAVFDERENPESCLDWGRDSTSITKLNEGIIEVADNNANFRRVNLF